jgi:hypothetical protein
MRDEVARVMASLLVASEKSRSISLDEIGEALGVMAITAEEIDVLVTTLESRGRRVVGPSGGGGESRLKVVLATARQLRLELSRAPNPREIATRASMTEQEVRHALALAKVISKG